MFALLVAAVCVLCWQQARPATFAPGRTNDSRKVAITRTYTFPVAKGTKVVAAVPALMSFWGATNQQVILESQFTYSTQPDSIQITADDRGQCRRNYELTWNSPQTDSITVTQKLKVELNCTGVLKTAAKLPYPKELLDTYASSLDKSDKINTSNPALDPVVKEIAGKSLFAEDTVEMVCDWVNNNIKFKKGSPADSDATLKNMAASCSGMSNLACAILRKMNIPAETVSANFIGGGGHAFIEVFFPDAGWVFYDLSNCNRGFKSLDCLLTAGYSFRVGDGHNDKWYEGDFLDVKDAAPYKEDDALKAKIRPQPKEDVAGATVTHAKTPDATKVRLIPLSKLIMDLDIQPGKRDYSKDSPGAATQPAASATQPASPATKPAAAGKTPAAKT
jgi:hypothetical protein